MLWETFVRFKPTTEEVPSTCGLHDNFLFADAVVGNEIVTQEEKKGGSTHFPFAIDIPEFCLLHGQKITGEK